MQKFIDGKLVDMSVKELAAVKLATMESIDERRNNSTMSRSKFAIISAQAGWITEDEALAWVGGTAIPKFVYDIITSYIPKDKQLAMKVAVLTQENIGRMNTLIPMLMSAKGISDGEMDSVFGV
ncbi:MAG: hypothetical protein ACPG8W_25920 [Candidatus Promineifilaceae bacterium]